jgi:undecaprenyl-diphosphatase
MILIAILFGIIQGITEFFPISSSGHLLLFHRIVGLPFADELAFDVALHLAALLALVWIFRSEVAWLTVAWFKGFSGKSSPESRLAWLIILASLPALLVGYFFGDGIEAGFRSPAVVIFNLAAVGVLMIIPGNSDRNKSDLRDLATMTAVAIGIFQALAIFPGVSRSGITIIAGIFFGLKRQAALKFSFLSAMPVLAAASLAKVPDLFSGGSGSTAWIAITLGFIAALLTSLVAIKFLMRLLEKYGLRPFGIYRLALAAVMAIIFYGLA